MQLERSHLSKITLTLSAWRYFSERNIPFDTEKYISQLESSNPCLILNYPTLHLLNPPNAYTTTSKMSEIPWKPIDDTTYEIRDTSALGQDDWYRGGFKINIS